MHKSRTSKKTDTLAQLERIENALRRPKSWGYHGVASTEYFDVVVRGPTSSEAFVIPRASPGAGWLDDFLKVCGMLGERNLNPRVIYFKQLHPDLPRRFAGIGLPQMTKSAIMTLTPEELTTPSGHDDGDFPSLGLAAKPVEKDDRFYLYDSAIGARTSAPVVVTPMMISGQDDCYFPVCKIDGEVAGFARTAVLTDDRGLCTLYDACTAPAQRRNGMALGLCRSLLVEHFAAGTELVWSECHTLAEATFCARLGFRRVGVLMDSGPGSVKTITIDLPASLGHAASATNPVNPFKA